MVLPGAADDREDFGEKHREATAISIQATSLQLAWRPPYDDVYIERDVSVCISRVVSLSVWIIFNV